MRISITLKRTVSLFHIFMLTFNILWTSVVFADEDRLNYEQIKQQATGTGNEELTVREGVDAEAAGETVTEVVYGSNKNQESIQDIEDEIYDNASNSASDQQ